MSPDERYFSALQGIQSAIAWAMTYPDREVNKLVEPKHLRVGVDSNFITHKAIARILFNAGICTEEEYSVQCAIAAEEELLEWEQQASAKTGINIKFR